jgi:hypothetical protein
MSNSRRRGFLPAVTLATALVVAGEPDAEPGTGAKVTVDLAGTSVSLPLITGSSAGK